MTAIPAGATLNQQLYMRLFDRLNTDDDGVLSASEIEAAAPNKADSDNIFKSLDIDGDGRVLRSEMSPSKSFGPDTLSSLIAAQAGRRDADPASSGAAAVADLFARADLDGDGALNVQEMTAEQDLRLAAALDAGYAAGPVFMMIDKNGDKRLTPDEVSGGQPLRALDAPASAIHFFDELSEEEQRQFQAMREAAGLPPLDPLTAEQKEAQRAQWAADRAERVSGPAGTMTFLSSEIEGLRTEAREAFAKQDVTDSLSRRLLQQILQGSWKSEATV